MGPRYGYYLMGLHLDNFQYRISRPRIYMLVVDGCEKNTMRVSLMYTHVNNSITIKQLLYVLYDNLLMALIK